MRKKALAILIVCLFCAVFATSAFASTSLMLAHAVNIPLNFTLGFKEYSQQGNSTEDITDYEFDGDGRYLFASLYLTFNRTLMFDSITVTFTDMVNTANSSDCYPYQMEVLVPGSETEHLVEVVENAGGHGAGKAMIISSATAFKRTNTEDSEDRRIADFAITLSGGDSDYSGTYVGTVTLGFVAN